MAGIIDTLLSTLKGKKKKPTSKDYGGKKQESGKGSTQPGSLYRPGGRKRQLDEMEG